MISMLPIRLNMTCLNKPFLLEPVGKDYLWGGQRLNQEFNKHFQMNPLAESWEASTHHDGLTLVASGEFKGCTLKQVLRDHPYMLGTHPSYGDELPILVKFIDAKQDLSLQVHPDDMYALANENSLGKTEMWYVVDASDDASLVYGFYHDITKETLKKALDSDTIMNYVQKVNVKKDDVFFIEPGTIHAIGKGCLIAEVQQSSNLTYRIFDYHRGRQLHLNKAMDVLNTNASNEPRQPLRTLRFKQGIASDLLCRCKYFQVERLLLNTLLYHNCATISTTSSSFHIYVCIDGCATIAFDNQYLSINKGTTVFVPANSTTITIQGKATFLKVEC